MYIYQTMSNNFGYIDIILLGMIAGFIILRLRNILGRKTGHEPKIHPGFVEKKFNVLNNNIKDFIYASSSSVYGNNKKIPFSIKDNVDNPISLYAATKKSNELIANAYSHLYDLNTTGLRFFTVYGPWGRPDMAYYSFTKDIINNKPISVFNNGNMKRDFTFIDDIIFGVRAAIEKNYKCEIFNLGNNKSENILEFINILQDQLNTKAVIKFKPMQQGDVKETYANIEKSKKMLNYIPTTSVNKGIKRFVDWYKKYHSI